MNKNFDRAAEDLGNIVGLEHINLIVGDHRTATTFYVTGLGFTRDPYLNPHEGNMWVNMGRSQFHLPVAMPGQAAQILRGHIGMVVPNLADTVTSLEMVKGLLKDTKFAFTARSSRIDVTCPWGNSLRVFAPDVKRFGPIQIGVPYVEFNVGAGTADGIARFYSEVMGGHVSIENETARRVGAKDGSGGKRMLKVARVSVGFRQELVFREKAGSQPEYDGHHLQLYVANFSKPHDQMVKIGMEMEESNQHQYRFYDIVDPKNGKKLFSIEHEIRSMTHPLYARPLVNRNPAITNNAFAAGNESLSWHIPYAV
jgi:hypothetical protein